MSFRHLMSGFDTIECAYYLMRKSGGTFDFALLGAEKEGLKFSKSKHPKALRLGTEEFLLANHGTGSGFPFLLENESFSIQCGEFNKPNFFVTFRSYALWHHGAMGLHQRFLTWAGSVGLEPYKNEALSRVDFTFDYWIDAIDFDEDNFVTTAVKDNQHRKNRKVQTFTFGTSPIVLRVYNKSDEISESSGKEWFYPLWGGQQENVWRIEWEIRKAMLRLRGIRTFDDLNAGQGDVLRPLVEEGATLRLLTSDSNRSRWPLHPLWVDLSGRIAALNCLGVVRVCDPDAELEERMLRSGIAVYGYLKRVAAIHALQRGKEDVSKDEALRRLGTLMDRFHDPLTWDGEVKRRITEMRLGQ
jgi:hypothetical protein